MNNKGIFITHKVLKKCCIYFVSLTRLNSYEFEIRVIFARMIPLV